MASVSAGKTAGRPASKARFTKTAFTALKTSFAAVSTKTAFTALESSFTTVFPETVLLTLKTSFAAVSTKTAFAALESSFSTVFPETALLTRKASLATVSTKTAFTTLEPSFTTIFPEAALSTLETSFAAVSTKTAFTALELSFTTVFPETALSTLETSFAATEKTISTTMKISAAVTGTEAGISPEISIFLDFTFILRLYKTSLHFRSRFIRIPCFKIFRIKHIIFIGINASSCLLTLGATSGDKLGSTQVFTLAGRILQRQSHIRVIQKFPAPGFQIPPPQGADAHAHQLADAKAQTLEHLTHLTLQPLFQNNAGTASGSAANIFGPGISFRNAYAAQKLHQHGIIKILIYRHPIFLFNAAGRMGKDLGQFPLIRHNQKTFGISIQPSNVIQMAQTRRQQVINSAYGSLRFSAAYIPAGLVQQHYNLLHRGHMAAVHLHEILLRHPHPRRIDNLPVHFHAPFSNQPVGHPAGINAAGGQEFINADTSVFFGAMLFFTHIGIMSAISADDFVLFILRQFTSSKGGSFLLPEEKSLSVHRHPRGFLY